MRSWLRELVGHRGLLLRWTIRDLKVRYKQTYLGAAWAILQPLSTTIVFTVVFAWFVRVPTGGTPHVVFYYAALLPWTLLSSSLSFGANSLINNMHLVRTTYFPREILPLAAVLVSVVDFVIASLVFAPLAVFYEFRFSVAWCALPAVLIVQLALTVALVLFVSALTVFYRDLRYVVPLGLQLWLYLSPVIYPVSAVPEGLRPWYMLNPMAAVIESVRRVILAGEWPRFPPLVASALVSGALLLLAYRYFKRTEDVFADLI